MQLFCVYHGAKQVVARNADAIEEADLVDGLFILQIPVHDGDRKPARLPLIVTLTIVSTSYSSLSLITCM